MERPKMEEKLDSSSKALRYSRYYGGKISLVPKVPINSLDDFSVWYTPGVASVSLAISKEPDLSFELTNRWNTAAVLTNGSRVLGLGNVGPEASLPVMEGKALIYKYLGGVDAFPLPIRAATKEEFISVARAIEPAFGAINLEDIESPACFEILETLRSTMSIPVWHDDQQGTAGIVLAALFNALDLTDRKPESTRVTLLGAGAANIATANLLIKAGFNPGNIVIVDSNGILHPEREDMDKLMLRNRWKYELAIKTNSRRIKGGISEALTDSDVLIAASKPGPNTIQGNDLERMNKKSIVFLLANPVPEMWPEEAEKHGAYIVATGRSDFPNQVNNSLLFPSVFRGCLDVRAKTVTDTMIIEGAKEIAGFAKERGISRKKILPTMVEWEFYPRVAARIGTQAVREGVARKKTSFEELLESARERINSSRRMHSLLYENGIISREPE